MGQMIDQEVLVDRVVLAHGAVLNNGFELINIISLSHCTTRVSELVFKELLTILSNSQILNVLLCQMECERVIFSFFVAFYSSRIGLNALLALLLQVK